MSKLVVRVDGSCMPNPGKMGIGVVIYLNGQLIKKVSEIIGNGTNNIAEYRAVIKGLEEIKNIPARNIEFYCDSQLVVKQLNGQFKVKNKKILFLFQRIQQLLQEIKVPVFFNWNPREDNQIADQLASKLLIQEEENQKAIASGDLTIWQANGVLLVKSKKREQIHRVNLEVPECDCDDFQNHCKEWNLECKHIMAARKHLQEKEQIDKPRCDKKIKDKKIKVLILSNMVQPEQWKEVLESFNDKNKLPIDFVFPQKAKSHLDKQIASADVIVGGKLAESDLRIAQNLKLFQIPFVGVDTQNLKNFKKFPHIDICNTHGNSHAVSEHAFGLLLALAKNLIHRDQDLRKGRWHGFVNHEPAIQIYGKNLGVIGLGSIGLEITQKALSFGMKVYAIKRSFQKSEKLDKKYGLTFLGTAEQLEYVIQKSDFIIIALPLTDKTKNIINENMLKLMKGKYLINVGRGKVINEESLYHHLKNGILAGAGIDAWYQYPDKEHKNRFPSQFDFHKLDNVIMTPHSAGYSDKAIEENIHCVYENIARIYYQEKPENRINLAEGY